MSHILKILLKVILKRKKHKIEFLIIETQSGFMAGKGTREGIYNLRTIIERYIKCGKNIYLCFIDYEKAFDRVKHAKLIECMDNLDIDGKDKLDKKSVLESKSIHENRRRVVTGNSHQERSTTRLCVINLPV